MIFDFTPLFRPRFVRIAKRIDGWHRKTKEIQLNVLTKLLRKGAATQYGKKYNFHGILESKDIYKNFSESIPLIQYEDIRPLVMRMIDGEKNLLWPGKCVDFAQSSGTSGGKSKYIPVTKDSLSGNHYRGGEDAVAHYLRNHPESKIFAGKGFILGGSFSNSLEIKKKGVNVGDLSATLINRITPLAEFVRIPDRRTALMADWEEKLPALVKGASTQDVTNISGVPSWFLTVIQKILKTKGADKISQIWPNLEVFFHGGISFEPYREEYQKLAEGLKMHFVETYNASEGFFAVQNEIEDNSLLLIIDRNVFYEFIPADQPGSGPVPSWEVEKGRIYEMVITASNGLWRYRLGDTVRVVDKDPIKIRIAGRTGAFINAFGEELMEDNAERGIAAACDRCRAQIQNYSAAPVYAKDGKKGYHQWLIEWEVAPENLSDFATVLDEELRKLNSDYDAKRTGNIFLDKPKIETAKSGLFDAWLKEAGTHKLGGQRKVPRLANNRELMDRLLILNKNL